MQTTAAFTLSMACFAVLGLASAGILFMFLIFPPTIIFVIAYLYWSLRVDDSAFVPRRPRWLSKLRWWQRFADYFPVTLVKTAELDPDDRYVFGYHPHGVISVGALSCFATEGPRVLDLSCPTRDPVVTPERGFSNLFPGIEPRLVTLAVNFQVPLLREYLLSFGLMCADRRTFRSVLSRGSGSAVAVVVGGAKEATETRQGGMTLVLEKRKGFVREAMAAGASLVPVIAFGENDVYNVQVFPKGHVVHFLQERLRQSFSFSMPIFSGRGVFWKCGGLMPLRKPIWVVVGAAVPCKHIPNFDAGNAMHREALDEAHQQYIAAVENLYDSYKDHPLQPYRSPDEHQRRDSQATLCREASFKDVGGFRAGGLKIVS